jgi:hypothetical protein
MRLTATCWHLTRRGFDVLFAEYDAKGPDALVVRHRTLLNSNDTSIAASWPMAVPPC